LLVAVQVTAPLVVTPHSVLPVEELQSAVVSKMMLWEPEFQAKRSLSPQLRLMAALFIAYTQLTVTVFPTKGGLLGGIWVAGEGGGALAGGGEGLVLQLMRYTAPA
jgi:hypothetical protein